MAPLPQNLVFTRAESSETYALTELAQSARATIGVSSEQIVAWDEEILIDPVFFQSHVVWTLTDRGTLVGWGAWIGRGRRCRLEHLWIRPERQRQGLGRLMLIHLAQDARAAGWLSLEFVAAPSAVPFYRACGARAAGVVEGRPGRILPVMVLEL